VVWYLLLLWSLWLSTTVLLRQSNTWWSEHRSAILLSAMLTLSLSAPFLGMMKKPAFPISFSVMDIGIVMT